VVAADFTGDGRPDLVVASAGFGTVSVLPNRGGAFRSKFSYAAGTAPTALAVTDFNGDGRADLAAADATGNAAVVALGRGDGTLAAAAQFYSYDSAPYVQTPPPGLLAQDFTGDGRTDVAAGIPDGAVDLLRNTGAGKFNPATVYHAGGLLTGLTAADVNADGLPDVTVVHSGGGYFDGTGGVLRGAAGGGFEVTPLDPTGLYPVGAGAAADLNGDGIPDLVTVHQVATGKVYVYFGNGSGGFGRPVGYSAGSNVYAVIAADLNGDGFPDLAVTNRTTAGMVTVLLNRGDGTFGSPVGYAVDANPVPVAAGDFNGDGKPDLAAVNDFGGSNGAGSVSILLGNGDGTFQPAHTFDVGDRPSSLAVADYNDDGKQDLAVGNYYGNSVTVLLGNGDGTFSALANFAAEEAPVAVNAADFNGDGTFDLAVTCQGNAQDVLLGNGDGTFQPFVHYAIGQEVGGVVVEDFNGDGRIDIAVGDSTGPGGVGILVGKGDGTFLPDQKYSPEPGVVDQGRPDGLVAADFNGDGRPDLAGVDSYSNLYVLFNTGTSFHATVVAFPSGPAAAAVVGGDFNSDGFPDVAVANNAAPGTVSVLLGRGDGTFVAPPATYAVGANPVALVAADFTGDGRIDLAVADQGSGAVTLLRGTGAGTFRRGGSFAAGSSPSGLAAADLNGDGVLDLVVTNGDAGTVSVLLGQPGGTFAPPVAYAAGPSPRGVVIADINGDGTPDVAVANKTGTGTVSLLPGNGDGTFAAPLVVVTGKSTQSLAAGDFNGDGFTDLAVGNADGVEILLNAADWPPAPPGGFPRRTAGMQMAGAVEAGRRPASYAPADNTSPVRPRATPGPASVTTGPRQRPLAATPRRPAAVSARDVVDGRPARDPLAVEEILAASGN
jgi:hypothetical protein